MPVSGTFRRNVSDGASVLPILTNRGAQALPSVRKTIAYAPVWDVAPPVVPDVLQFRMAGAGGMEEVGE